jgi:hypothetical protein
MPSDRSGSPAGLLLDEMQRQDKKGLGMRVKPCLLLASTVFLLAGCGQGAAEKAGAKADAALEKAGDSKTLEQAGEKVDAATAKAATETKKLAADARVEADKAGEAIKTEADKAGAAIKTDAEIAKEKIRDASAQKQD